MRRDSSGIARRKTKSPPAETYGRGSGRACERYSEGVTPTFRADLHVHSRHSDASGNAGIRALRSAESFTDPVELYHAQRARGMDFVTITDHNTLAGLAGDRPPARHLPQLRARHLVPGGRGPRARGRAGHRRGDVRRRRTRRAENVHDLVAVPARGGRHPLPRAPALRHERQAHAGVGGAHAPALQRARRPQRRAHEPLQRPPARHRRRAHAASSSRRWPSARASSRTARRPGARR